MQNTVDYNPFRGPAIQKVIPMIQAQAEIWIACKIGGDDANRAYNESVSLVIEGSLNTNALHQTIEKMTERHEALRATFSPDGRFMTVFDSIKIEISEKDISNLDSEERQKRIKDYLAGDARFVFDLIKGPLLKIGLLKLSDNQHQLVITGHHIVCDGWSMGIILEELSAQYNAIKNGTIAQISEPATFSSYAEEEQKFLRSGKFEETERFWLEQYKGNVPTVTMPTDYPRPQIRTYKSNRLDFPISSDLVGKLKQVGIKSGASLVVTLMAGFEVFLNRLTGQNDLVLGLPAAGQSLHNNTHLIGHCVNLLPLRSSIDTNTPFNEYLKARKNKIFDAYEHQQFSFGQLLQKLAIARDPSRVPLVPVAFNIDMGMDSAVKFDGLTHKLKSNPRAFEAFELFLNATGSEGALILEWSYNTSLFSASSIKEMMISFTEVLESIVDKPTNPIGDIIKTDVSAYAELNNTQATYPKIALPDLFSMKAEKVASKIAVTFQGKQITYGELDKQIHQMANYLKDQGVKKGDFVGVALPRSIEMVSFLFAIMKCGAAYVPLDPNYPSKRLEYMLEDSEATFLITSKNLTVAPSSNSKILYSEDILPKLPLMEVSWSGEPININGLAYLLYTSGSTGKPKGVQVTHKNLVNLLQSVLNEPGIQESDIFLSITTISFDIAGAELYAPLLAGAQLLLADDTAVKDTRLLLDMLKKEKVSMMQATPATWQMLLDAGWKEPLPIRAISTGEALPISLFKTIIDKVDELWNLYGPTETTIWSTVKKLNQADEFVTIGRPLANTQCYLIDERGSLVEPGKVGELCIAGDGVSNGYLKRPELTNEKFIENPFNNHLGPILYKTGDLAKITVDGDLQCLGRIDQQVKIRGHRIELGEIEDALDSIDGIDASVVLLNNDRLIAYIISPETLKKQTSHWKDILRTQLPLYMVPQEFIFLNEFPKTLNGKIDRKALQGLENKIENDFTHTKPNTKSEEIIAKIWEECLNIDNLDVTSDFFELGGHSLVAVRVMTKIEDSTGNRLPLVALLKHPTVKKLAAYMDKEFITWDCLVPLKPEGTKPPLYIVHGAHHNVLIFNELAQALGKDQPVYGLQARGLDGIEEPHDSMHDMARDYLKEIMVSNPDGPYCLAGFSLGGTIAFEMARQLREQGKTVKIVAEFDTYVFPDYYYENPLKKKLVRTGYTLLKIGHVLLGMMTSKKNFKWRMGLFKQHFKGIFLRLKYGKEKQHEMQHHRSLKMEKNHINATDTYTIKPQDIVIDLFKAEEEINLVHDKKYLGWKSIATKGVRRHMVLGNHIDMFDKEKVHLFAEKLQHALDTYNVDSFE